LSKGQLSAHDIVRTTRSWLINLPERSIYTWDQLCAMFIRSFQGTYERLSTTETLKTIKQKHDESLWDRMKHFCNFRNTIPYIQDIEITNTFRDGVSDIKTVEEIVIKKPRMVVDLLAVTDVCIEALKAQTQLFESRGKGSSKKKRDNREVNMTDRGDHKDCGDHGYRGHHQQQSSDQKEKMPVRRPDDVESGARSIAPQDTI
jgi:hypothetical protein